MGTASVVVVTADNGIAEGVFRLPYMYRIGYYRWGYFDYKGETYRVDTVADRIPLQGIADPEIIAYAKTLWELSR